MKPTTKDVSRRLLCARQSLGWSQARLARAAGLSQRQVCAIEIGQADNPGWRTMRRLERAMALGAFDLTCEITK